MNRQEMTLGADLSNLSFIRTVDELRRLYEAPAAGATSLIKEIAHINAPYRAMIEAAPFFVLASSGPEGMDCSPRGDAPGFVRIHDEKTLLIPDRRGNNRIDSLQNILHDPRVALLFLIPGCGETLRVNGRAAICTDADLCASFAVEGKSASSVIVVTVERVYFQCPKALVRSKLWDASRHVERSTLPTSGAIMKAIIGNHYDAETHDRNYPERLKATIY
jgi:PPOX class probable FMN-dependent enzyme